MCRRAQRPPRACTGVAGRAKSRYGIEVRGRRLSIFWAGDGKWFSGTVKDFGVDDRHCIKYEDGDVKWHDLTEEEDVQQLKWLDDSAPRKRKPPPPPPPPPAAVAPPKCTKPPAAKRAKPPVVKRAKPLDPATAPHSPPAASAKADAEEAWGWGSSAPVFFGDDAAHEAAGAPLKALPPLLRPQSTRRAGGDATPAAPPDLRACGRDAASLLLGGVPDGPLRRVDSALALDHSVAIRQLIAGVASEALPESSRKPDAGRRAPHAVADSPASPQAARFWAADDQTSLDLLSITLRLGALGSVMRYGRQLPYEALGALWRSSREATTGAAEHASALAALRLCCGDEPPPALAPPLAAPLADLLHAACAPPTASRSALAEAERAAVVLPLAIRVLRARAEASAGDAGSGGSALEALSRDEPLAGAAAAALASHRPAVRCEAAALVDVMLACGNGEAKADAGGAAPPSPILRAILTLWQGMHVPPTDVAPAPQDGPQRLEAMQRLLHSCAELTPAHQLLVLTELGDAELYRLAEEAAGPGVAFASPYLGRRLSARERAERLLAWRPTGRADADSTAPMLLLQARVVACAALEPSSGMTSTVEACAALAPLCSQLCGGGLSAVLAWRSSELSK